MKHYSAGQLVDFVNGLVTGPNRAAMQHHLDNCGQCQATASWISEAVRAARSEPLSGVPAELTAHARGLFQIQPVARGWLKRLQALAPVLVFDSATDPLPIGLRSGASIEQSAQVRHLAYRAGTYNIDLRMEPVDGEASEIVGQVTRDPSEDSPGTLQGALVQLIANGRTVGETETNRFGEFLIQQPGKSALILRIALRDSGQRIDVPIRAVKRN